MDVVILVIYFVVYFEGPLEYNKKKTVLIEPNLFTFIKEFVVWGVFYSISFFFYVFGGSYVSVLYRLVLHITIVVFF